jgi:hypothetical protein
MMFAKARSDPMFKCEKDEYGKHIWEKLGIYRTTEGVFLVRQCTQCEKCIEEKLEFLEIE